MLLCSKSNEVVLDPFLGSGTVAEVAIRHGRTFLGIELNPDYVEIARRRIGLTTQLERMVEIIDGPAIQTYPR